jgi:aryl-alcohol dehydrogenase-like predicted oxidoreductase
MTPSVRRVINSFLVTEKARQVPYRTLGKTGLRVKAIGLGGQALLETKGQQKASQDLIAKALDLGVNYFDTAPLYGPSREYLGKALKNVRQNVILASKVYNRTYSGAKKELNESFNLLQTDYLDLVQLHALQSEKDLKALKQDGALTVLKEAQQAGKIRFIGITGHYDPDILIKFMNEYPFDTVLMAMNPAAYEFDKAVLVARDRGIGIIGMKVMSRGILPAYFSIARLLKYALKRSDVAIIGCSTESDLEKDLEAASDVVGVADIDHAEITDEIRKRAGYFLKGFEKEPWPSTYQPDLPNIKFEKK